MPFAIYCFLTDDRRRAADRQPPREATDSGKATGLSHHKGKGGMAYEEMTDRDEEAEELPGHTNSTRDRTTLHSIAGCTPVNIRSRSTAVAGPTVNYLFKLLTRGALYTTYQPTIDRRNCARRAKFTISVGSCFQRRVQ